MNNLQWVDESIHGIDGVRQVHTLSCGLLRVRILQDSLCRFKVCVEGFCILTVSQRFEFLNEAKEAGKQHLESHVLNTYEKAFGASTENIVLGQWDCGKESVTFTTG